jgi:hypothetical protein
MVKPKTKRLRQWCAECRHRVIEHAETSSFCLACLYKFFDDEYTTKPPKYEYDEFSGEENGKV